MADVIAKLADGTELHFPDGTSPDVVQRVVKQHINAKPSEAAQVAALPDAAQQAKASQPQIGDPNANLKQSQLGDSAVAGTPTAASLVEASIPGAFAVKHPVQAAAAVPGALLGAGAAPAGIAGAALTGAAGAGMGTQVTQALSGQNPVSDASLKEAGGNAAVGGAIGAAAGAVSPVAKWIGASKSSGAKFLQAAADKAADAPVELSPETNRLMDEIMRQDKSGNTAPKVIKDLLTRVGPNPNAPADAQPGPLTYPEARDFQSNASRLSAGESMNAKGSMKALIAQFSKSFSQDVQNAADQAGVGTLHRAGMTQYAQASGKQDVIDSGKDVGGKAGKIIAGSALGAGGFEGSRELLKRFGIVH
jgi:hypothetical protein